MAGEPNNLRQGSGSEIARPRPAYVHWIKLLIYLHGKRHPETMGNAGGTAPLNHLAVARHVAIATQKQALSAIEMLGLELAWLNRAQISSDAGAQ